MKQGQILKKILEKNAVSPYELAEKLGIKGPGVYTYFRTKRFSESKLNEICEALGISTAEFEQYGSTLEDPPEKYHKSDPLLYKTRKPFYDVEIFATPGAELMEKLGVIEPTQYISVPHFADIHFYIRVSGDSMYPRYRHGDIIAVKKIDHSSFFSWYEPYVIITRTNTMRMLKYVHPDPENENNVLLVSYDKEKYLPQPLPKEEIFELYLVKGKIEL